MSEMAVGICIVLNRYKYNKYNQSIAMFCNLAFLSSDISHKIHFQCTCYLVILMPFLLSPLWMLAHNTIDQVACNQVNFISHSFSDQEAQCQGAKKFYEE